MTLISPPRYEGVLQLPDSRRLGFAEFGTPHGRAILWFHGTPGGKRQIPPAARDLAVERDIRLIGIDRPGIGLSSSHLYDSLLGYADDIAVLCDHLGIDRFGLVGLSGGGPYVLACAAAMPERVVAGCVLGGVAPVRGEEGISGGMIDLAARFDDLLELVHRPMGSALHLLVRGLSPGADPVFDLFIRLLPEGDRVVMSRPEMKEMFLDDLRQASRGGFRALLYDALLFSRPWGFHLRDITVPIHFYQGDSDTLVPLEHGQHQADLVPGASLSIRPTEGHMGSLDAVEQIFDAIEAAGTVPPRWPRSAGGGRPSARGGSVSEPARTGEVDITRLVPYRSPIDDNHRWAGFTHRPGDVFVCTPPKCGTTWTQTIVTTLIFNGDPPDPVLVMSPWLEMRMLPVDEILDRLDAQDHRRCIKTHTPADGIPWWDDTNYLVVGRDGRDVAMSLLNHMRSTRSDVLLEQVTTAMAEGIEVPSPPPIDDVHEFFDWFVESGPYFRFFARFWDRRHQPNVLFVHFNDLKSDLDGQMRRIAAFLGLPIAEDRWADLVESCTFAAMKARPDDIGPFDLVFEGGAEAFLYRGTNERWRDVLTPEEVATYEQVAAERLPHDAWVWLSGGAVPGVSD